MATATPAVAAPAQPVAADTETSGFGDTGADTTDAAPAADDKPFDDEPFDAGVAADEETDPKKYIEQLTGKLGQSLRKYNEEQGQPDFELEKFAINSLLSATHTSEMDEEDKKDIIKKVNTAGNDDSKDSDMGTQDDTDSGEDNNDGTNDSDSGDSGFGTEDDSEDLEEYTIYENENFILPGHGKRMSIFAPEGSEEFMEENRLDEIKPCWKGYKQVGMKEKGGKEVPNCVPVNENHQGGESLNYMFWQNLKTIHHAAGELLEMNQQQIDEMCANGHAWAVDHVASSADDIEEVYHFFESNIEDDSMDYDGETEGGYQDEYGSVENVNLNEAEYEGKTVTLGKPSSGDVKNKKFKVYVKNKKGKVVKVNFGDANMEIKRDNPERKKSFRARHNCAQAKDRTTPKYWSCKMWSNTPVSKMVAENLINPKKISIFDKSYLTLKLQESFNQNDMTNSEPAIAPQPVTKPTTKPVETPVQPSRRNKPFTVQPAVQPAPKALKEGKFDFETYHKTLASCFNEAEVYTTKRGYDPIQFELSDPQHVAYGQTQRYNKELTVDGKLQRKELHIQIYRMDSGTYELNMYVN
jgi:hypothetical protein